ncbi:MAG: alpha/beta fold hydrolase [Agrococcus casei]
MIPHQATEERAAVRGGQVRVLRRTAAAPGRTPLVLVHGGGTDNAAISWHFAFSDFGDDRDVIAFDLPGFGETANIDPLGGPAAMAEFTIEVLDALGLDRVLMAGVSMGGDVVLNVALLHPERLAGIVLVAPGGLSPVLRGKAVQFSSWAAGKLPDAVLFGLSRMVTTQAERMVRGIIHESSTLPDAVLREFVAEQQRPGANVGYARYNQATLGPWGMKNDLRARVHEIETPALFFHGAEDPMVCPQDSQVAAALMPDARIHLIPSCGHWAQLEKPTIFKNALEGFFAEIEARRTAQGS